MPTRTEEERDKLVQKVIDMIEKLGLEFGGRLEDIYLVLEIEDGVWEEGTETR